MKPPPVIDNCRVLLYAEVPDALAFSGHTSIFVKGMELGRVPCLAIGTQASGEYLLFHCDRNWSVLGCSEHGSISEAQQYCEKVYPGLSRSWIETNVTESMATEFLKEIWKDQDCSFCGKIPPEIEQLVEKSGVRICDGCIREFYALLDEPT